MRRCIYDCTYWLRKIEAKNVCKAKDIYISPLFRKSLNYASKTCSKIYILSAKYGLLRMDDIISPYNETLNQKTEHKKKVWASKVHQQTQKEGISTEDEIMFLCGENYCKYLKMIYKNSTTPLAGLKMGKRLKWLKESEETT